MMVKFLSIFLKLLEILIKVAIVICFTISLLVFIYQLHLFTITDFNINFMDIDRCVDMGRWWNYEEKVCMWISGGGEK